MFTTSLYLPNLSALTYKEHNSANICRVGPSQLALIAAAPRVDNT